MATHPKKAAPGAVMGRPTLYDAELVEEMREVTALGWTMRDIAEALDVDPRTVRLWRTKFLEFRNALKAGRAENARRVAAERKARALQMIADAANTAKGIEEHAERQRQPAIRAAESDAIKEAAKALAPPIRDLQAPTRSEAPVLPTARPADVAEPDWRDQQHESGTAIELDDPLASWPG